jgi:hypothetical protein
MKKPRKGVMAYTDVVRSVGLMPGVVDVMVQRVPLPRQIRYSSAQNRGLRRPDAECRVSFKLLIKSHPLC